MKKVIKDVSIVRIKKNGKLEVIISTGFKDDYTDNNYTILVLTVDEFLYYKELINEPVLYTA